MTTSAAHPHRVANPHRVDRAADLRRRDAAARCEPLADGRRDSHGRRRSYGHGLELREAREHLALVLRDPATPPAVVRSLSALLTEDPS